MPPVSIRIERLSFQDVEAYQRFRVAALRESPSSFASADADEATAPLEDIASRFVGGAGRERFVMAARGPDNGIAATCGFYRQPGDKVNHIGWLWGIHVAPYLRRQGVAARLLRATLDPAARLDGLCQIQARVGVQNLSARALLEAAGFEFVGVLPRSIRLGTRFVDEALLVLRTDGEPSAGA